MVRAFGGCPNTLAPVQLPNDALIQLWGLSEHICSGSNPICSKLPPGHSFSFQPTPLAGAGFPQNELPETAWDEPSGSETHGVPAEHTCSGAVFWGGGARTHLLRCTPHKVIPPSWGLPEHTCSGANPICKESVFRTFV